ncbi:DUF456 domain-containing protein [Nocardia sp. 004]|uniref:DUF456 domain-containing protein n=1 Tax=Nocardia sp. 004 TaxID=3385978 RepID=UPI0039A202C9
MDSVAHQGWFALLVGFVILIGLIGIVVPILPGVLLIFGAIAGWAFLTGGASAWTIFAICTALLVVSGVVKYAWPGRRMQDAGVSRRAIFFGAVLGIIGFFVVPVIGLFVGFVLGVYLSELYRLQISRRAWQATVHAVRGVGLSILIELAGALLATGVWIVGLVLT